jgi:hypothetical protein
MSIAQLNDEVDRVHDECATSACLRAHVVNENSDLKRSLAPAVHNIGPSGADGNAGSEDLDAHLMSLISEAVVALLHRRTLIAAVLFVLALLFCLAEISGIDGELDTYSTCQMVETTESSLALSQIEQYMLVSQRIFTKAANRIRIIWPDNRVATTRRTTFSNMV